MLEYGVAKYNNAVYLIESCKDDHYFSGKPEYDVFTSFSIALNSFLKKASAFKTVDYYSFYLDNKIHVAAISNMSSSKIENFQGPYRDPIVAYGISHVQRCKSNSYTTHSKRQFNSATHAIYEFPVYIDDENFENYVKCSLPGVIDTEINITPDKSTSGFKAGDHFFLRMHGRVEDISVFPSAQALEEATNLPACITIPIGTYFTALEDQDSTFILTGLVDHVLLLSERSRRRYQLTLHSMAMDVDLDVFTNYAIQDGDYIVARTKLSASFN